LRKQYATWFLAIFIGEASVAALALVAIGVGWLHVSQWVASAFFVTVFLQIAAVVQTVARGLFADHLRDLLDAIAHH